MARSRGWPDLRWHTWTILYIQIVSTQGLVICWEFQIPEKYCLPLAALWSCGILWPCGGLLIDVRDLTWLEHDKFHNVRLELVSVLPNFNSLLQTSPELSRGNRLADGTSHQTPSTGDWRALTLAPTRRGSGPTSYRRGGGGTPGDLENEAN